MAKIIPVPLFDCVVFGATGDLTLRKLLPALYYRYRDGQMPDGARIVGVARSVLSDDGYRDKARQALEEHVQPDDLDPVMLARFLASVHYVAIDATADGADWARLTAVLDPARVRVFYLATAPYLYGPICRNLAAAGLVTPQSRVVLEKPIGRDLASAREINDSVGAVFAEAQTYRIDHFLGKETVQNLLALRFANTIFERLWTSDVIDHVQITVAEEVPVGRRGPYYESAGVLRDMFQNHLLQLLMVTAMEAPVRFNASAVRNEKVKVLDAIRSLDVGEATGAGLRGQY
ncbi:MAG: glucose-6-phosphate dehydrogenase, partial [Rhodospirillales bacterium]